MPRRMFFSEAASSSGPCRDGFVEFAFFDVVSHGWVYEFAQRLAGGGGFADGGGGDGLVDAVEYMNGCAVQDKVAAGRLFFEGLGDVGGRAEFFGEGVGYVGKRVSGAGGYDEFDFRKSFRLRATGRSRGRRRCQSEKRVRRVF